jgi:uncharacterized membrane protein (DUF4010 family)
MMDTSLTGHFLYREVALKIAVTLGIGLLVGLEREWAQKEVGVRTFAIVALLGTLAALLGSGLTIAAMVGVFLLVTILNAQSLLKDKSLEMTTSAAMIVMLVLGVMVGRGDYFPAVTGAVLMAMLLAWKFELSKFADALLPTEIRSALLLGLLSFVIYPLLPNRFVDPWNLINPRQSWLIVVVIAGIGFVNYVLLRLYGRRGLTWAAILGGLVNSTAAAVELAVSLTGLGKAILDHAVAIILLTNVAMFARNLVILGIFSPQAAMLALAPLAAMTGVGALAVWIYLKRDNGEVAAEPMKLVSPVSLKRLIKFAILFVVLAAVGTLAQRHFHTLGFLAFSLFGGLVSSASTTATAAELVGTHQITPQIAATGTVITSIASALITIPLVYQQIKNRKLLIRLIVLSLIIVAVGVGVVLLMHMR